MTPTSYSDYMKLGDHDHQDQAFNEKTQLTLSTLSTQKLSYSQLNDQQEENNFASEGGSSNDHNLKLCLWENDNGQGNRISGHRHQNIPYKWLPSKLRFVRMMMGSDRTNTEVPTNPRIKLDEYHGHSSSLTTENRSNGSSSTPVRVCSDCKTTKTPLWRSGPQGPKSLCNACGIRQRKARRALAIAAAAANGTTVEGTTPIKPKVQQKNRKLKANTQFALNKKRSRVSSINVSKNKPCFEDFLISLSKNLAFHQVFPQDEKEAAILLMALSCNLVHG